MLLKATIFYVTAGANFAAEVILVLLHLDGIKNLLEL